LKRKPIYSLLSALFRFAVLLCLAGSSLAQPVNKYPRNYFRWPVDINPEIVANFGELRPNHWHMGLDIRTNQKENMPVYAAAPGYIAHIGIRPLSFGRFIIINHPNGLSTLYGHLNNFFPALEKYVTEQQYKQETWAIELDFQKEEFPVSKNQFIAYSGNTGGSQGPHVHFEIRDTKTGECLNPLLFGFPLQDDVPPGLLRLAMYDRSGSIYEQAGQYFLLKKTDSGYIIPKTTTIKTGLHKISFGIQAFDRMSSSRNENGIYSAQLFFDEQPMTGFIFDSISYKETGYVNAHIDYRYRYNGGPFFQHLSQLPGDRSGVYHAVTGNGVINLRDSAVHLIRIAIKDAYQNISELNFFIQHKDSLPNAVINETTPQRFLPNHVNVLEKPGFEIYLPEGCLYDTVSSFYYRNNSFPEYAVSASHQVNDPSVPVQDDLVVRITPDKTIPPEWKDKIVIQRSYRNSSSVAKAEWTGNNSVLSAKFGDFGSFQAFADVIAPAINEPGSSRVGEGDTIDLSPATRIVFQPKDNFGVIKKFRAELDGQWLRFANDKGWSYIYVFDERCPYGIHELKVTAEDLVGNTTIKSWWFKKYPYTPPKKKVSKKGKKTSGKKRVGSGKKKTSTKK
jgi:murein DD-endopeptidase MepM/ murein hydrolase activator NlpD